MAFRSDSMTSLNATDGIPVKVNEKFFPPKKYDFTVEQKVLEWSRVQVEMREAIEKAAAEKLAKNSKSKPESNGATVMVGEHPERPKESSGPGEASSGRVLPHQPFLNVGSSMLTPIQVQKQDHAHNQPTLSSSVNDTQISAAFDLRDFEQEQDPFENLELKTLNDMEELNKVLQGSQSCTAMQSQEEQNAELQGAVHTITGSSQSQDQASYKPHRDLKDVEYPEIDSLSLDNEMVELESSHDNTAAVGGRGANLTTVIGHQYYSSGTDAALPEAGRGCEDHLANAQSSSSTDPFSKQVSLPVIDSSNPYLVQQQQQREPSYQKQNTDTSSQQASLDSRLSGTNVFSKKPWQDPGVEKNQILFDNCSIQFKPNGIVGQNHSMAQDTDTHRPTTADSSLRSTRSTPDISHTNDMRASATAVSHTPPPHKSPRSRPVSPPPRPSTKQDWNRYSILPPTTPSGQRSGQRSASTSNIPQLTNPFNSLSTEDQRLANSIADMGFPRDRVARAIQKLGQDDKKVIDFLCLVNRMSDEGYDANDIETALHLFDDKEDKTEQYLKLLYQFKELGFPYENIQTALISSDLNENKALDILTSS